MHKRILIIALLWCITVPTLAEIDKSIVATVNGKILVVEELKIISKQNKLEYKDLTEQQKNNLIKNIIQRMLLAEEAIKQKLDKNPKIKQQIASILDSALTGMYLRKEIYNKKISEAEIEEYYTLKYHPNMSKFYRARQILIENKIVAKEIFEQLISGEKKFSNLAFLKSIDKKNHMIGGAMGWLKLEQIDPKIAKVVKMAKLGEVNPPFKTKKGWHIIVVEKIKDRDSASLEDSKNRVRQLINAERRSYLLQELKKKADIKIMLETN